MKLIKKVNWRSWLLLSFALLCACFANGRWLVPVMAWTAPPLFLIFVHRQKILSGLIKGGLASAISFIIAWQDMTPLDGPPYVLVFFWLGIFFWIPYCVDRLVSPSIRGFASTLVFPAACTGLEFVYSSFGPLLSNGSIAYTQYDSLAFIQIISITGIWGITFLVTWTAAVIHWVWREKFIWKTIRRGVFVFIGFFLAVLVFGESRLLLADSSMETVRVAGISATERTNDFIRTAEKAPAQAPEMYRQVLNDYLNRTRMAASTGASIIAWDELAVRTGFDSEAAIIEQGQLAAREARIHLLMTLRVEEIEIRGESTNRVRKNEAVLIGPDGEMLWTYLKSFPTPGDREITKDKSLPVALTPAGVLSAAICLDATNPEFMSQAGRVRTGLMLNPAWNHAADAAMQLQIAVCRAIENGFSLLRPTRGGFSAACDNLGRLTALSKRTPNDGMLIADIPIQSRWTLYPYIGDLLGWLCAGVLVAMVVVAIVRRRRQRRAAVR